MTQVEIPQPWLSSIRDFEHRVDTTLMIVSSALVVSPFPVEEPCMLHLEVETEEGVLNGGAFSIEKASTPQ